MRRAPVIVAGSSCGPCVLRGNGDSQLAAAHAKAPSTMTLCRVFIGRRKVAQYRLMAKRASGNLTANSLPMSGLRANQALVADEILLDGRLALFHRTERWLAVADVHFGYELSQRAAGALVPLWGMATISERLSELVKEYSPQCLIVLGDL